MVRLIFFLSIGILANAYDKCKVTEESCMVKLANDVFTEILSGNDELDPMRHEIIEGNLSGLKYSLTDTSVTGFKNCRVDVAKGDFVKLSFDVTLLCPAFLMRGNYSANGQIITLPVEGSGNYTIQTKKYRLGIKMDVEMQPKDGKSYLHVKSFSVDPEPLEQVVFKFDNLFNGNKELAEPVLKFANENWMQVTSALQSPVFQADLNKIIKEANKHLKKGALEEYFILE
ncbi:protein takeout [Manduca sexta]|uniref:protein takeout n=1 Tax=Manduca sexta TaxID=7130 RepID=UPI00188FEE09|nr:protein takeout [Manduca sexta]